MSKENQKLSYDELIQELTQLCNTESTGTMFIVTDTGHSARIGMKDGNISCFAYRMHKGLDALMDIYDIKSGKYHFSNGIYNPYNHLDLPETPTLLQQFKFRTFPQSKTQPDIDLSKAQEIKQPGVIAGNSLPSMSSEKVIELIDKIESLLLDSLGPFADIAIHDYLSAYQRPENKSDFNKMIEFLLGEIDETDDQLKFKQGCQKLL